MDRNGTFQVSPSMEEVKGSPLLKAILLANLAANVFGGAMHLSLLVVTAKNKQFHSPCHLLIAASCLSVLLAYLLVLVPLCVLFVPSLRPSLAQCFRLQLVPLFANFHVFSLSCAIGFERLLSVFRPIWYLSRNNRLSLLLLLSASALFPLYIAWIAFGNMVSKPNVERACTLGELLGHSSRLVNEYCLFCILLSVACYTAVWIRLRVDLRGGKSENETRNRQAIFKSLCTILCLQVCGWTLGQLAYAAVYSHERSMSPLLRWQINSAVLVFLSLTAAMEVPVLHHTRLAAECGTGNTLT